MDSKQLSEELNLKAMTALTGILQDEARGLITPAQAATGVRAIFDMAGGLISQESFDLISLAAESYKGKRGVEVNLTKNPQGHLEGVIRFCGSGAVVHINQASPHRTPEYTDSTDEEAKVISDNLFQLIRKKNTQW